MYNKQPTNAATDVKSVFSAEWKQKVCSLTPDVAILDRFS